MEKNINNTTKVNYQHKDRIFRDLFGSPERKENLLSLYNALNGTDYQNPDELYINTIDDVVYMGMKNDVSCIIDNYLSLYEHQSSYNPNMPLRGLMYFGKLYSKFIQENSKNIYSSRLIRIPTPQYYIFYNGEKEAEERSVLRLSDAFAVPAKDGSFEWTATMLNINYGKNQDLMEKCRPLQEYSIFIATIHDMLAHEKDIAAAVTKAVDKCIAENILAEYLLSHKAEVIEMCCLTEYNEKETLKAIAREEREVGREEVLISLVKKGLLSVADSAKYLSMSETEFKSLL